MESLVPYTGDSPPTGEHFEFRTSARGPAKQFSFEWTLKPGKRGPGEHVHPRETETFAVEKGLLRVWIDGVPKDLGPGDVIAVPAGVRHRFLNPTKEPMVCLVTLSGTDMEDAFMPFCAAVGRGKKPKLRTFARWIVHMYRHPASVPTSRIARGLGAVIMGICWMFGARAFPTPAPAWDGERAQSSAAA